MGVTESGLHLLVPQKPVKRPGWWKGNCFILDIGGLAGWMGLGWGWLGEGKNKVQGPIPPDYQDFFKIKYSSFINLF